jgi:hypothetical protein
MMTKTFYLIDPKDKKDEDSGRPEPMPHPDESTG